MIFQALSMVFYKMLYFQIIYEQMRASVSREYPNTTKQCMKTRAQSACVFIHFFRLFGYTGETRARVVYMASQMNRDVTKCFGLLISILFLMKRIAIVIRNSIQIHIA